MGFNIMWIVLSIVFLALSITLHKNQFLIAVLSGITATIVSFLTESFLIQVISFVIASLLLFAAYFLLMHFAQPKVCSIESAIGERCTVVERISNLAGSGEVKVGRNVWSARSVYDDLVFECGDQVLVVAVEGVKLICKEAE